MASRKKPHRLVPEPFWQDELPLVWLHDDGPRMKKGRWCVMSGAFAFARYNRKPDAELVIRRVLSALDPDTLIVPGRAMPSRSEE